MHRRRDQRHVEKRVRRVPGPTRSLDRSTFTLLPPINRNIKIPDPKKIRVKRKTKNSYFQNPRGRHTRPARPLDRKETRLDDGAWQSKRLGIARCRWPSPLSGP